MNHIVLFDFPLNLPDYLHRVGRTGRVGSQVTRPRVSAFMSHRKDVLMALKIKDAATRQVAIMERKAVSAMSRQQEAPMEQATETMVTETVVAQATETVVTPATEAVVTRTSTVG